MYIVDAQLALCTDVVQFVVHVNESLFILSGCHSPSESE